MRSFNRDIFQMGGCGSTRGVQYWHSTVHLDALAMQLEIQAMQNALLETLISLGIYKERHSDG